MACTAAGEGAMQLAAPNAPYALESNDLRQYAFGHAPCWWGVFNGCLRVTAVGLKQLDEMIDFAIARVSEGPDGPRRAVCELATHWPQVTGLQIVFVMVSAAHAIERVFSGEDNTPNPETAQALRMASLLSVDLFAMQKRGNFSPTGSDLLAYWRDADPFFVASSGAIADQQLAG